MKLDKFKIRNFLGIGAELCFRSERDDNYYVLVDIYRSEFSDILEKSSMIDFIAACQNNLCRSIEHRIESDNVDILDIVKRADEYCFGYSYKSEILTFDKFMSGECKKYENIRTENNI